VSLTLRQKELVQDTWERVAPAPEAAARLFYDRLFEMNPQLRALFPAEKEEMEEQILGEEAFIPEVREAWAVTYALLAGVMKDAAATAPARTGYQPDGPLPGEPRP
jgi:hemoglobin-like flavoprotein